MSSSRADCWSMKSSGRGIFLVRSFMDDFSLARLPDQGTEVRFAKKLSRS